MKSYSFFFPLDELRGLPEGYQLGACKVQKFTSLPPQAQRYLSSFWKYVFERDKSTLIPSFEDYQKRKTEQTYLCCDVQAIGYNKAVELAKRSANRSISIYNCLYMAELRPLNEYGFCVDKMVGGGYNERRISDGWRSHHPIDELEGYSKLVSSMTRIESISEIEQNVLSAIDVYGLIQRETPVELKFLLSVIALEGLLSGKYDFDFLAWKLREKVALLIGDDGAWIREYLQTPFDEEVTSEEIEKYRVPARRELARRVARMYGLRSQFAHARGKMEDEITDKDFRFASFVFRFSLQRVLQLHEREGIRTVSKPDQKDEKKEKQSLDWLLETLRYSQPLKLD